jgi:hypothetical protein
LHSSCRFSSRLDGGKQKSNQNAVDGIDHLQFDKIESLTKNP